MNNINENRKVWFVTGASQGLGLAMVKKLLAEGFQVAATSRSFNGLTTAVGEQGENFLPLVMDLIDEVSVKAAIASATEKFGKIDVVVNNAGYGQIGTLEELSDEEARKNFDVNVFGVLNVIRNVMPQLRAQRSGHVFNISSIGGYSSDFPAWGIYCATKYAVAGLTGSFAAEASEFDVKATVVYPGLFRTNFLTKESSGSPAHPIAEYEKAREIQALFQDSINGTQMGDPEKAAEALIKAALDDNPPVHLLLGKDAYDRAQVTIADISTDFEGWKEVTVGTDFSAEAASKG